MPNDFRFIRRLDADAGERLSFTFDDVEVSALSGDSVAAALLAAGIYRFRHTPVGGIGSARGPFCLMGACFECLLEIDGVPNCQACMVEARDGMRVRPMRGARADAP